MQFLSKGEMVSEKLIIWNRLIQSSDISSWNICVPACNLLCKWIKMQTSDMDDVVSLLIYAWFPLKEKVVKFLLRCESLKGRVTEKHTDCQMSTWREKEATSLSVWVYVRMRPLPWPTNRVMMLIRLKTETEKTNCESTQSLPLKTRLQNACTHTIISAVPQLLHLCHLNLDFAHEVSPKK